MSKILQYCRVFVKTLFYNEFTDWDYCLDVAFAPLFSIIDNYGRKLGLAFAIICILLICQVVIISYWIGLPYWWKKNPLLTIFLLIIGNWLKMNCAFHYYMGIKCNPGYPPKDMFFEDVVSICKKCIQPKPHRTHHCSVCNECILQMDHHCPWLNNCVGHFNRRYFYMFMAYVEISVIFLIVFGIEIAYKDLWLYYVLPDSNRELYGYVVKNCTNSSIIPVNDEGNFIVSNEKYMAFRRRSLLFIGIICTGTAIALGVLLFNHSKIISRGETSIEKHINRSKKKLSKNEVYKNPYNFGMYNNWTIFLGIKNGTNRNWFHIFFPSTHKPFGDGINWPTINSTEREWETFFNFKHR